MKRFLFLISLVCLINTSLFSNCYIGGEVINSNEKFVIIQRPINGYYNNTSFDKEDTLQIIDNKFTTTIDCRRSVFITLFISNLAIRLVVKPEDSIIIKVDLTRKDNNNKTICLITGANAVGQSLFYDYNYWPAEKFQGIWKILKGSPDLIVAEVKKDINKQIEPYLRLYNEDKISEDFFELISTTIKSLLLFESIRKIMDDNIRDLKLSRSLRIRVADSLFNLLDPQNESILYGVNSSFYSKLFLNYKKGKLLKTNDFFKLPDTIVTYNGIRFNISGDFSYLLYEQKNLRKEVLFGSQLLNYLTISGGSEILKNEIDYFKAAYPNSKYLKPIVFFQYRIIDERRQEKYYVKSFEQTPISILDSNGRFNDLPSILKEVNKPMLYVDVWATWCGPCISEMKYNFRIDSFLYANNIKRLYISIDEQNDSLKWRSFILKFKLGGYHILASDNIKRYLAEKFGLGNNLIAIPIYFIIKNGKIEATYRPSEFEKLKEMLIGILRDKANIEPPALR